MLCGLAVVAVVASLVRSTPAGEQELEAEAPGEAPPPSASLPCGLERDDFDPPATLITPADQVIGGARLVIARIEAAGFARAVDARKLVYSACAASGATFMMEGATTLSWTTGVHRGALLRDGEQTLLVWVSIEQ